MRIVLMGPPGAGKGTQAKRLAEKFEMAHLSSGDLFRAERASGSELGQELAKYMDAGQLVPDDTVVRLMAKAITQADAPGGLLLDGFPRTVKQAEALDAQLAEAGKPLNGVLVITCEDDEIVQRITGRRSCPECGKGFHVEYMPSERGEFCDECGGDVKLQQRSDDTEDVVRERLAAYYKQTEPVIGYYRQTGDAPVVEVDGSAAPDAVTEAMVQAVEELRRKA